jgi:ribosomal-protein-serine acetyltransferase
MRKLISLPSKIAVDNLTTLKIMRPEDASILFTVVDNNRERLSVWLPWVQDTKAVSDSLLFIEESLKDIADSTGFPYGIWYEGKFVGVAGAVSWDVVNQTVEIGAWLDADHEGKGIVTNALKSLIEMIFTQTNIVLIQAFAEPSNVKSNALVGRLNFSEAGETYKTDTRGCRLYNIYELRRNDWQSDERRSRPYNY